MQDWTLNQQNYAPFDSINGLDVAQLNLWVDDACEKTNKALLEILFKNYQF